MNLATITAHSNPSTTHMKMKPEQIVINGRLAARRLCAIFACLAALLALLVTGCQTQPAVEPSPFTRFDFLPTFTNTLSQADVINISFRYSTNFNTVQKIGSDGLVNLEGVGEIKAEGKTVRQLEEELTALYRSQAKDDPITVKVVGPVAAVYVTGAVLRPGKVPLERQMTVIEALAEAGGYDQTRAKLSRVSVLRMEGDSQRVYWLNLNEALNGKASAPFFLKPFDVVRVPAKTFNF